MGSLRFWGCLSSRRLSWYCQQSDEVLDLLGSEMKSFAVELHAAEFLLLDETVNDLDIYSEHFTDLLGGVQQFHLVSPVLGENVWGPKNLPKVDIGPKLRGRSSTKPIRRHVVDGFLCALGKRKPSVN